MENDLDDLAERIRRLEAKEAVRADIEAIKKLDYDWYEVMDNPTDHTVEEFAQRLADLCTDDVELDFGPFGIITGPDEVRRFAQIGHARGWSSHSLSNFTVRLDGDRATGWFYVHVAAPHAAKDGSAAVTSAVGRHDAVYVRTPAGWRISKNKVTIISNPISDAAAEELKEKMLPGEGRAS